MTGPSSYLSSMIIVSPPPQQGLSPFKCFSVPFSANPKRTITTATTITLAIFLFSVFLFPFPFLNPEHDLINQDTCQIDHQKSTKAVKHGACGVSNISHFFLFSLRKGRIPWLRIGQSLSLLLYACQCFFLFPSVLHALQPLQPPQEPPQPVQPRCFPAFLF